MCHIYVMSSFLNLNFNYLIINDWMNILIKVITLVVVRIFVYFDTLLTVTLLLQTTLISIVEGSDWWFAKAIYCFQCYFNDSSKYFHCLCKNGNTGIGRVCLLSAYLERNSGISESWHRASEGERSVGHRRSRLPAHATPRLPYVGRDKSRATAAGPIPRPRVVQKKKKYDNPPRSVAIFISCRACKDGGGTCDTRIYYIHTCWSRQVLYR